MIKQTVMSIPQNTWNKEVELLIHTRTWIDQGHFAEWKKSISKGHVVYDSVFVTHSKYQIIEMESRLVAYRGKGLWCEGNGCDYKGVAWETTVVE